MSRDAALRSTLVALSDTKLLLGYHYGEWTFGPPAIEAGIEAGRPYRAADLEVEYDASTAAHLFAVAAATGGAVTVTNARQGTLQPDAALPGRSVAVRSNMSEAEPSVARTAALETRPRRAHRRGW